MDEQRTRTSLWVVALPCVTAGALLGFALAELTSGNDPKMESLETQVVELQAELQQVTADLAQYRNAEDDGA